MSEPGRRTAVGRIRDAVGRRVRGPYEALGRLEEQIGMLDGRVRRLDALLRDEVRGALLALAADEVENRRLLATARSDPEYEAAWTEARPLISVTVATIGRQELLSRSLPSILAQSHRELEVIVVDDSDEPGIEQGVAALGDPRVRYVDLGLRQTWTDHPGKLWYAGATRARNAALELVRGRWVVEFDDDDAMRPKCLESLLSLARDSRGEAVYGRVRLLEDGAEHLIGSFPPRHGQFSWAAGMYHGALRFFERQFAAADLGLPGDWWLAERMLRAGVRFAMRAEILADVYASGRKRTALEGGGLPWVDTD